MKVFVRFKEYLRALTRFSNEPVSMQRLLEPFSFEGDTEKSDDLLVGYVLDSLAQEFKDADTIDALDVATAAAELGFAPAEEFLDAGPHIIANAITAQRDQRKIC